MVKIIDNLSEEYMDKVKLKINKMISDETIKRMVKQIDKRYAERVK